MTQATAEIREKSRLGLEKRKACDLCHIKKIRCDARRPICSHCTIYGAQCIYTPNIKRRRKEVQALKSAEVISNLQKSALGSQAVSSLSSLAASRNPGSTNNPLSSIPQLADILPIIKDYFKNVNIILPLFDESLLMAGLDERSTSADQCLVTYGAVNVILALAFQFETTKHLPISGLDLTTCISKAQLAIDSVATSQHELVTLQTLLGLVILHLGMPHPGLMTAGPLLGRAVKLAHRLRLHRKKSNAMYDATTSLQRVRIFWILYILDRYISSRTHDPLLQQEDDYDIPMPSSVQRAGLVSFTTESGTDVCLDVFQSWIHLARIQGIIYEQLYSVRAETQSMATRRLHTKHIPKMLMDWLDTIPRALHPDRLSNVSPSPAILQLILLYFMHLSCTLQLYGMFSHDAEWIARLVAYSQRVIQTTEPGSDELDFFSFLKPSSAWSEAVGAARECARLFRLVDRNNSRMKWSVTCIYMSATIVLIANALTVSEHGLGDEADADEQLIEEGLSFLAWNTTNTPEWAGAHKMYAACVELSCRARIARARYALALDRPGPKPASVAWFEKEARRSAGHSALALVEAFTMAEGKPVTARLWQAEILESRET